MDDKNHLFGQIWGFRHSIAQKFLSSENFHFVLAEGLVPLDFEDKMFLCD